MQCERCGRRIYKNNKFGVCSVDPECRKIYQQRWHEAHPADRHEYNVAYYAANKDRLDAYNRQYRLDMTNLRRQALRDAKRRAAKAKVAFELTLDNLPSIPEMCPALGIPLARNLGSRATDQSPSLDRIMPWLGYVPDNVRWISLRANRIKTDATPAELYLVAAYADREWTEDLWHYKRNHGVG